MSGSREPDLMAEGVPAALGRSSCAPRGRKAGRAPPTPPRETVPHGLRPVSGTADCSAKTGPPRKLFLSLGNR